MAVPHMDKYKRLVKLGGAYPELFSVYPRFVGVNTPIYEIAAITKDGQIFHNFSYSNTGDDSGNAVAINDVLIDGLNNQAYNKSTQEPVDYAWLISKLKQIRIFGSADLFRVLFYTYAFKIQALTRFNIDVSLNQGEKWDDGSLIQIEIGEIKETNPPVIIDVSGLSNLAVRNKLLSTIQTNFPDYESIDIGNCDTGKTCRIIINFGTPTSLNALSDFHINVTTNSSNGKLITDKKIITQNRRIIFQYEHSSLGLIEREIPDTYHSSYFSATDDVITTYERSFFHLVSLPILQPELNRLFIGWVIESDSVVVFDIEELFNLENYQQTNGAITFDLKMKYKKFINSDVGGNQGVSFYGHYGAFDVDVHINKRLTTSQHYYVNQTFFYNAKIDDNTGDVLFTNYNAVAQSTTEIIYTDWYISCKSQPAGIIECHITYISPIETMTPYNSYLRTYPFPSGNLNYYDYGIISGDYNENQTFMISVEFDEGSYFYGNYLKASWKNGQLFYDGQQVFQLKYIDYYFSINPYQHYNIEKIFNLRTFPDSPYDDFVKDASNFATYFIRNDPSLDEPFEVKKFDFYGINFKTDILVPTIQLQIPFVDERLICIIDTRKQQSICYVNLGYRVSEAIDLYIAVQSDYENISFVEDEIIAANSRLSQLSNDKPEYIEITVEVLPQLNQIKEWHETLITALEEEESEQLQIYQEIDELYREYKEDRLKLIVNNFCGMTLIEELARLEQPPMNYYII